MSNKQVEVYTTGNTYYVHSSGADTSASGAVDSPKATLQAALLECVANQGDIIYVLEGHAEAIATAGALSLNVAGVRIFGLGTGTTKPTFTLGSATTADVDVIAENIHIENLRFVSDINSLAVMLDVNIGKFTCVDCEFISSSTKEVVCFVDLATTFDDFIFRGCTFYQPTDPEGTTNAVNTGCFYFVDSNNILIEGCRFNGYFESSIFHNKTTLCGELWIKNCWGSQRLAGAEVATIVDNSYGGMVGCNFLVAAATDASEAAFNVIGATTAFGLFDCLFMNDEGGGGNLAVVGSTACA